MRIPRTSGNHNSCRESLENVGCLQDDQQKFSVDGRLSSDGNLEYPRGPLDIRPSPRESLRRCGHQGLRLFNNNLRSPPELFSSLFRLKFEPTGRHFANRCTQSPIQVKKTLSDQASEIGVALRTMTGQATTRATFGCPRSTDDDFRDVETWLMIPERLPIPPRFSACSWTSQGVSPPSGFVIAGYDDAFASPYYHSTMDTRDTVSREGK